ncbi:hypothetical protein SPRG_05684 [Saprolegnia parasitica CBS 223.65]|uniref:FH2 domain-containing protein n=1 Tax=Saprolegnia parasitica (strain CBS 223.65) TaxID=695850 RepID=A0A067CE32_SAPPC|nr:hypothetical protein SPRG_05684 [Saprolegnia parasitica CBS 223.65]KDO28723.1 hypothetical protein SPRG_05684 [Saprolegnia parasitica CBS 223.65]|eukprot:XP_012200363.1 hypothetical protein SPRG_05684 [Saprolegnia parasitica CBS 223.65]
MNYLRRSNSSSGNAEGGSTAATAALRSIYSSTGSGQRALVFTVEVPERGPLGLDLKARFSANVHPQRGAVVKGFKPNRHGKKGYIESTGRVKEKDILVQLHDTKVDDMPFDAIVDLAAQLQDNPMAWPLRLEFKREPEVADAEPAKPKGFSGFLRAASMSLPGLSSSTAHAMTTAPPPPTITSASAQDGSFQDKLNYFRGFFKDRLPTSTENKAKKVDMPPLPASDIVNDMYRELLMKRNVPEDVLDELVRIESLENKWSIVWSAKQHENDESSQGYIADAIKIAEALVELHWDNKGLALLETLHRKIASSTAEWTDQFVVSYGLDYLTMKMPEPSPFSIEHHYKSFEKASRFCENIIRILLSLSHFASGIDAITSTLGLVDRLALCFHTESSDVKKITLQVLGIICYNSAEGHQSVVHSFSNYKEVKGEMIRFTCLRDALKSTRYNLLFKEDVLSFINILVNKGLRVESRIEIRQDFVALGISEYFEEIRMKSMAMYAKAGTSKDPVKKAKKKKPKSSTPPMSPVAKPSTPPPPPAMGRQFSQGLPSPGRSSVLPSPGLRRPSLSLPPPSPALRQTSTGLPPTVKIGVAGKKAALPEPLVSVESPVHTNEPVNDPWAESPSFSLDDASGSESDEDDPSALTATELQIREQLDNMERQMEVFEVFMEDDRKTTLYGTTDLSSLDSVVSSIMTRVVLDEELRNCFLSILQQLLFIPADQVLGKEMWSMCERVTKEIALLSPVDEVRRYELSFEDRKRLLSARDTFTAFLMETAPELSAGGFSMGPIELLRNRAPHDELSDELTTSDDDDDDDNNSIADPGESAESAFRAKVVSMLQKGVSLVEIQREMGLSTGLQVLAPYFKLQKMGMPLFQVQMKMQADGLDASVLEQPGMFVDDDGKPLPPATTTTTTTAPTTVKASEHVTYAKFFKLLKMGMPLEHVKLKASSEGVDASMLDTPDKLLPIDTPPAAPAGPAMVPIKEHPKYAKFFKLLKMGMPAMQVELKMQSEGVDPSILGDPEKLVPDPNSTVAPPAQAGPVLVAVKDHPKYAKFFKLMKMGMPAMQVELKMQAEGHDTSLLSTPDKMIPEKEEEAPAPAGPVMLAAKDHPKYAKFFKLQKMGMPPPQIELKMKAEGCDVTLLSTPDKMIPEKDEEARAAPAQPVMLAVKDHPKYAKFFKLQKMGMPPPQIELKMKAENLDTSLLSTPDKMIPEKEEEAPAPPADVLVKDHPDYAKYLKLKTMGMPLPQIELKMQAEGLNPALLATPDAVVPAAKPLSTNVAVNVAKFVAKVKAKPKLRNLYWEPVAAPTETSLWSKIELSDEHQKELDSLTTLFASAPPAADKEKKKPAAKKKVATRVALIDAKRANNLGIMLARFRLPYPEIKRAVLEIDRDVLTTEKIAALIQFAPEGEELETVKAYTGEVKLLGDAEQYYLEISTVPRYATRLQAVLATWQFDANVEEQRRLIESVNATCAALKANEAIPEILKLVLALGNTLNEGTPRGGAQGFKLSILLKLVQVKAADNSMTLLNYLAIVLRKKNPEWLTFTDQLEALNEASRVTLQVLKAGEAAIKKASSTVVSELELHAKLPSIAENDKFQDAIAPFAEKSVATSAKVVEEFEAMMTTFNECVQWFGEDPEAAGCGPDSFFSIFVSFGQMLAAADRDNERKRIAEEKRVRREAETRKRMEALASSKQQRKGLDSLKEGDAQAIVKKIRGKRSEEKRRELLEQGFDPTSTDSICSNSSRQLKSQDSLEAPPSSSTLHKKEERP